MSSGLIRKRHAHTELHVQRYTSLFQLCYPQSLLTTDKSGISNIATSVSLSSMRITADRVLLASRTHIDLFDHHLFGEAGMYWYQIIILHLIFVQVPM
jgi:hypothetical protein